MRKHENSVYPLVARKKPATPDNPAARTGTFEHLVLNWLTRWADEAFISSERTNETYSTPKMAQALGPEETNLRETPQRRFSCAR
jgi:hypothetical protein